MSNLIKLRFTFRNISNFKNNIKYYSTKNSTDNVPNQQEAVNDKKNSKASPRVIEFQKKLREKTPLGKLEEHTKHPFAEKEPLIPWPNNTNPNTGEIGGPAGPEPTRYGDWERKGRVSDF